MNAKTVPRWISTNNLRQLVYAGKSSFLLLTAALFSCQWQTSRHYAAVASLHGPEQEGDCLPGSGESCSDSQGEDRHRYFAKLSHPENEPRHGDAKAEKAHLGTRAEMRQARNCFELFRSPRPLYTEAMWSDLRRTYRAQGGIAVSHDETDTPEGFVPPTRPGQTVDGKGRGIFAARDIQKGERTYGGKANFAFFPDGPSFRKFIDAVPDDVACDLMEWAWPQPLMGDDYETLIVIVLDNNSLMNNGGEHLANTGCPEDMDCGMFDEYALRDIPQGEEILCDYGDFLNDDLWTQFGL